MAISTEQMPKKTTAAESEFDRAQRGVPRPEIRVNQSNQSSGGSLSYIIGAVVLVIAAYFLYTNYAPSPKLVTPVTQTETTAPAPVVVIPVTPPAAETVTPPVVVPTPPAATVPATPPAAGTTSP